MTEMSSLRIRTEMYLIYRHWVLLFSHNYVRQGFYSPVVIRKLAVTKFYPDIMKLRNSSGASAFVRQSSQSTS